jgi:hypothetical protein
MRKILCTNCNGKGEVSLGIKRGVCPECNGDKYKMVDDVQHTQDHHNRLAADLNERGLTVVAFICEDKNGDIMLISYDENGLVTFLSEKAKELTINRANGGRSFTPLARIGKKEST